ncbi:hypothetical protein [Pseudomonas phage D6]|nr:hypothetical protein [Pseudomonas phage D6]
MREAGWEARAAKNPMRRLVKWIIWGIVGIMILSVYYGLSVAPHYMAQRNKEFRAESLANQATRIIREEKESQFRSCIRTAAGQVGVASNAQIEKCKQQFLSE